MITLVLGGARSGKSRFAEREADRWLTHHPAQERLYVATAQIFDGETADEEMRDRID